MSVETNDELFGPVASPEGRARMRQLVRYLTEHHPLAFPVRLLIRRLPKDSDHVAWSDRVGDEFVLRIDSRCQRSFAFDLLLHEWAHFFLWPSRRDHERRLENHGHPPHDATFYAALQLIAAPFEDGTAVEDSKLW